MSKTVELTKDVITDAILELAEESEEIPTKRMWEHWNRSPCGATAVRDRFGGWTDALAAAGLPRNPPGPMTAEVRAALYRRHLELEDVP